MSGAESRLPLAVMWSMIFIFLSYLDRNFVKGEFLTYPLDAESGDMFFMLNSTFCARMSVRGENYLYQVSDGVEEVRSVHNLAGELVDCSLTVNQMQVKSFMHVCRLGLKNQMPRSEDLKMHFAPPAESKSNCLAFQRKLERLEKMATQPAKNQNDERENSSMDGDKVLRRSKRGFTYPGTLWCGAGNMATTYDDLGEWAETDSCCRVHDHCPYVIHAFSSNYGYTNFKWHSICHCDCDNALKDCLRKVNDTSSRVVGQAFFNVMEVPCFEFRYEEQCVERHWYGVCKRYELLPVAVAKESIPYDFGGIDVIDVLTLAPPKHKDSNQVEQQHEDPTEPTVPGSKTTSSEEPSLSNMVTAAEDFIKVLATVSTSQSSTAETNHGETPTSEKKKKKKSGKKKKNSKKRKGKGKERKRKQRVESDCKAGEAGKAEEVLDRSNFIHEPGQIVDLNRNVNDFIDLEGRKKPPNDVMKDEPVVDEESADDLITSPGPVKKGHKLLENRAQTENREPAPLSTTTSTLAVRPHNTRQRSRKGRKRQSNTSLTVPLEGVVTHNTTEEEFPVKTTKAQTIPDSTATMVAAEQQQRSVSHSEKGTLSTIVDTLKSKSHRSKENEGRNKRRRITTTPPTGEITVQHSTEDEFKVIARISSPTVVTITTVNAAKQLVSDRPDVDRERSPVTTTTTTTDTSTTITTTTTATTTYVTTAATTSPFSAFRNKRQRWREREGRKRMRKLGLPRHLAKTTSPQSASEDTIQMLTTTDCTSVLTVPTTSTSRPSTGQEALHHVGKDGERGRPGLGEREGIKIRKSVPPFFNDRVALYNDNKTDLRTLAATGLRPPTVSSKVEEMGELEAQTPMEDCTGQVLCTMQTSTTSMSAINLTLKKLQEQLIRKRRRKARLSYARQ